ncbi:MAG: hypothetical protein CR982_01610 [Candidatus Cloacimonadota bacterium]|nr:MAG: hypothetical protein CR982_01610 [Candidatus Cloacimonadota bacterium]
MRRDKIFFLVIISLMLFISCSDDSSPTDSSNTTQTTEVLTPNENSKVDFFSHETGMLIFKEDLNLDHIEVGDIVVGGISDVVPEGFLRKVVSKREENGKTIFETEQATITEAIKNCSYSDTISLDSLEPKSIWYAKGVRKGDEKSKFGIDLNLGVLFYDQDGDSSTTNDQVKLEGSFKSKVGLKLDFNIALNTLKKFEIVAFLERETDLLTRIGEVEGFSSVDKNIAIYSYPSITLSTVIPVIITPTITLTAKSDGTIMAKASYSISGTEENIVGGLYENGSWNKVSSHTENLNYSNFEINGDLQFKAGVSLQLKTKIYGVEAVTIAENSYGKVKGETIINSTSMNLEYQLKVGKDLLLESLLDIFSNNLLEYALDWNLFENSLKEGVLILDYIPEAIISTPLDNSSFSYGEEISFSGYGEDAQDGIITENIAWESNIDGYLGSGTPLNINTLSIGDHNISMTVTDSDGYSDTASIGIKIEENGNLPPMVTINSPSNGSSFTIGDLVSIEMNAIDNDGAVEKVDLYLNNDLMISLTSSPYIYEWDTANFEAGDYSLKAVATDNNGSIGESPITIITLKEELIDNNLIFVEGGSFQMGDRLNEGYDDELPLHSVSLNSFYIGKYEVTQSEYEDLMGSNPSNFIGENRPVEMVTLYAVVEYCNKLSDLYGLERCYSGSGTDIVCDFSKNGYRLPTEAEWEYAARGGIYHTDNFRYAGCDEESELVDYAWYITNSENETHEVGGKLPNQLGIYDMSGNVFEWCWDWYDSDYYSNTPLENPHGPESGVYRIIRGGNWSF